MNLSCGKCSAFSKPVMRNRKCCQVSCLLLKTLSLEHTPFEALRSEFHNRKCSWKEVAKFVLAVGLVLPKRVPVSSLQHDGTCRVIWKTVLGKGHSQYPLFFFSVVLIDLQFYLFQEHSLKLLCSVGEHLKWTPRWKPLARGALVPIHPAAETMNQDSFQASRKKPVIWVNGLLVYQNSNFVLLLSSNHLEHISPIKREKLERSKATALPLWTVANEQTQGSTHIAAGFPGRRHWLIKPCWALLKGRCLGGGCWGRDPELLHSGPTLLICASGCLLPL